MKVRAILLSLLAMTATVPAPAPAQSLGEIARKAQEQRAKAKADKTYTDKDLKDAGKQIEGVAVPPGTSLPPEGAPQPQVITLFEVSQQREVDAKFFIAGVGYVAYNGGGTILAGMNRSLDPFVELTIADSQDPLLTTCLPLLTPARMADHAVRITGSGRFARRPGVGDRPLAVLRLDRLSECILVPRG
jgi:hypothetical protein